MLRMKLRFFLFLFVISCIIGCFPREKPNIFTIDASKDTTFVISKYYNPLMMKVEINAEIDGEAILLLDNDKLVDTLKIFKGEKKYSFEFYSKQAVFHYKKINVHKGKIYLNIKLN